MIHAYLKIGEKQNIVFPRFILERNEIIPIPRSHTSLVLVVISARYLVQTYLVGFLVTRNKEINREPTETSRPSSTQKFSRYKQAGGGAFIPATLLVEGSTSLQRICAGKNPLYSSRMRECRGHAF